jgi:hypothetical protein
MNGTAELSRWTRHCRAALVLAAVLLSLAACAKKPAPSSEKAQLMFVQTAEDLKIDPAQSTFRLVKVNPQTLYFSDRPLRIAGHITMPAYLKEWTAAAGPENFTSDPPNATLSIYTAGQPDNTLAVVKISNPITDGNDLVYSYKLIEGKIPDAGGATALFIDWIGPGGGAGAGFHGAGAGARGVGVRR